MIIVRQKKFHKNDNKNPISVKEFYEKKDKKSELCLKPEEVIYEHKRGWDNAVSLVPEHCKIRRLTWDLGTHGFFLNCFNKLLLTVREKHVERPHRRAQYVSQEPNSDPKA